MKEILYIVLIPLILSSGNLMSESAEQTWIQRSDQNSKLLLEVMAKLSPEFAGQIGAEGVDDKIIDLKPRIQERSKAAVNEVLAELKKKHSSEKDLHVKQDLEILIQRCEESIREIELQDQYQLPYNNIPQIIYLGIKLLLDDRIAPQRHPAALERLKKYAGSVDGFEPVTKLAMDRIEEKRTNPDLMYPSKAELEKSLVNSPYLIKGIEDLFKQYSISGYEEPYEKLKKEIAIYEDYIRKEILPKARTDFRLPLPLYEFSLQQVGIDIPPDQLAVLGRQAFVQIQKEMEDFASKLAEQNKLNVSGYRNVIRELKKKQLVGDAILNHYQKRIKDIEEIIRREKIVTLPSRDAVIRLASEAESAAQPVPHLQPPRLIGNTGEKAEFVLPLNIPGSEKQKKLKLDDFTFEAASWTLTVHEARPGHELQFSSIIERGVSIARAIFAFNSVNVEGWALYSEAVMQPYEPLDGQMIALQHRLMRSARAFLDPELQLGKIQPEEAKRILMEDVVLSEAMASQEIERYMFRAPGQAPSYFFGYTKLKELRKEVEQNLGDQFNQQKYHDFILAQGLVPPKLLRKAVLAEFAPEEGSASN